MLKWGLAFVLLCTACTSAERVKVLTYNIGNANDLEPHYPLRLSYVSYEDYMGAQIRAIDADVVFLQEVLQRNLCDKFTETDPKRTCFDPRRPVDRILGDGYQVLCDGRLGVECIAVKKTFGSLEGSYELPALPLPACTYSAATCDDTACDAEATVGALHINTASGKRIRIVHAHPNAAGSNKNGTYLGEPCRFKQLEQLFTTLTGSAPTIMGGDWNLDLALFASDREKSLWEANVGPGKRFTDVSMLDAQGYFMPTRRVGIATAIDKVVVDGYTGTCTVYGRNAGGPDPGTLPLDENYDFSQLPDGKMFNGRNDHFAQSCELTAK